MKPSLVYKKLFKLVLIAVFLCLPLFFVFAQTVEDIQDKISQKNVDIEQLEQEIAAYQKGLDELEKQKSSLSSSIKSLDLTRKKLIADISVTQKKVDRTNLKIQSLSKDINTKQSHISNHIKAMALDIRKTHELESISPFEIILSDSDFTLIWNDIDNMMSLRSKIGERIEELKEVKGELEDTRTETVTAKNELVSLKARLADQKKIVEQNTTEKKQLLTYTKNNEASYQKLLEDRIFQKETLEREIRDFESQLTYILDPSKLPQKGVLAWPLDNVFITQLFGKTVDSKRLYASGSHSGVDLRASVGTSVKAMGPGVVAGVGDTDKSCPRASFGKYVFIKYDNGLASAFGHLSLVRVQTGNSVARGQVVAYSGNTGYSTGPHLHVTVYAPDAAEIRSIPSKSCPGRILTQPIAPINAYLDPMYFLPPYKKP